MAENEKNGDPKKRRIPPPFPLPSLSELTGQDDIRRRLTAAVKAAQSGTARVPHILFDGPPGLGKRTFARSLALELEGEWAATSGAELKQIKDVIPYLTNAAKDSVLFVDGIDRIPSAAAAEYLASAVRDFTAPITFGEGEKERLINVPLRKFTLVGTAAEPGRVNPLILDQFGIRGHFDFYTPEELSVIIRRAAAHLKFSIDDAAVSDIARRSGGRSCQAFDLICTAWEKKNDE
ncbi:MAG: AAA family ATPase [Thermoguttaceae bacterium]|nr:AAA family ATPase [Thermoguttaceae bacterium]